MRIVEITLAFEVHFGGMLCPAMRLRNEHNVPEQSRIVIDKRRLMEDNPRYEITVEDGIVIHYKRNDGQDVKDEITVSVFIEPVAS